MNYSFTRRSLRTHVLWYIVNQNLLSGEDSLRNDLTDTAGVLENKVLSMFHGLDDYRVLVEGF